MQLSKATVTTRRTCFCVLSTSKNVGKRRAFVRGEYHLRTESYGFWGTQTRRRTLSACKTADITVCGFTTRTCECGRRTCPVRAVRKKNVCNRTEIARCKHVQLTTCATYDARNRSRPDVACRPHRDSYTLRNGARDMRVTQGKQMCVRVMQNTSRRVEAARLINEVFPLE
ncbi:hypothetical protein Bbelb_354890 [Branchiostoma belcheri]|nr:hypothetical protein Bbelb_354890 [Branchiostoma belcheri]